MRELKIEKNKLGDSGVASIARSVQGHAQLTSLSLSHVNMSREGAETLSSALSHMISLENLDLSGNPFGDTGVVSLARALENLSELRKLGLESVKMGKGGACELGRILSVLPHLGSLKLKGNLLRIEGFYSLCESIDGRSSVKHLDLIDNSIDARNVSDELLTEISVFIARFSVLEELLLEQNSGTRALTLHLLKGLEGSATLEKYSPSCEMSFFTWAKLGLSESSRLKAMQIARTVSKFTHLTHLELKNHLLGAEAGSALGQSVAQLPNLVYLDLDNCQVRDLGFTSLVSAFGFCPKLTFVFVRKNGITDVGANKLNSDVANFTKLEFINLDDNSLSNPMKRRLQSTEKRVNTARKAVKSDSQQLSIWGIHIYENSNIDYMLFDD
jgi:Ran GTPase-activating protein (RanGAP) involved in mRNA processing and transport